MRTRCRSLHAIRRGAAAVALLGCMAALPAPAAAQQSAAALRLTGAPGGERSFPLERHRAYPAVPARALEAAGWRLERSESGEWRARLVDVGVITLTPGVPFLRLDSSWVQLVAAPYELGEVLYLPLQLFTDLLPDRYPGRFAASDSRWLRVLAPDTTTAGARRGNGDGAGPLVRPDDPRVAARRVVIIDPGHGGVDPGSLGPGRTREKDVTLAVARALARVLEQDDDLEVHLTRDEDVLVPIWERGQVATRIKGDRYGIFLSIHANAVTRRDVRGVETYFLSEARTDHEARVAALENSAMEMEREHAGGPEPGELGSIISELLNLDFQRWSSELAGLVQRELSGVHPGPDRGVKQGPLAVLTNAMMPSVLVEVGFITHPVDERLMNTDAYQREVAESLARAVRTFFARYPPGTGANTGAGTGVNPGPEPGVHP
ncbi:MAG: N-acetylmuramoyl-L-alanine amidase [Longimicrobiales bacterium]|nr:N-acetylmuramoyl-L-alanine amidase [Longimicrobiales bacterium]